MLKLKKLQILGFKSFCDRTELKFHGEGVAAIVGPNGCGKSNIADAISWVLGEQSAKSLRGTRMEDVIFIGTRDRKPTGMAEVSLTLVDPAVYEGPLDLTAGPEIDVQNDLPDDWDEAAVRADAQAEAEAYIEENRPGKVFDEDGNEVPAEAVASPQDEAEIQLPSEEPSPAVSVADASSPDHKAVILKIRRRKFQQKVAAGEIMITRRLFRSGESEYLLNGKLCRLRDIQEIFMGTGLGPETYAIIEQGRIGQILSSKPYDRRAIIEEAAGITKYKTKRRLAESRLEAAKQNLNRINDIFDEVTRQMNSLKRQAAKAERYAKLRDEMRDKLRIVLASKFAALDRDLAQTDADIASLSETLRTQGEGLLLLEASHAESTQRGYAIEEELRLAAERINQNVVESERATARRQNNSERCNELDARTAAAQAEAAATSQQLTVLQDELNTNRAVLESAASDVAAAQMEARRAAEHAAVVTALVVDTEKHQEERRQRVLGLVAQASDVRNQITKGEEQAAALDRESARLSAEIASANQQIDSFGGRRGQLNMEFESVNERFKNLNQQVENTRSTITDKRAAETECKRRLDTLRAEYATALGKRASLEALVAEHGYSTESVKRLFQSGAMQSHTPAGVLADFLEVDDQYERVVEDFLRDELNYVVVKSWDAADEGLRLLQGDVEGRATFLVHPKDAQARFSFVLDEAHYPRPKRQDAVVPVKNAIRVLNGFGKSLEVILPKLRDGYITPDPQTARDLALGNPNAFFLAPNGETFHNVTVTGGRQRNEGPLSLKRELRDVQKAVQEMEAALRAEETRVALLGREIQELTELLTRLEGELREADRAAMTSGHALQQLETELQRTHERLQVYQSESDRVKVEREQAFAGIASLREQAATVEQQRLAMENEIRNGQDHLTTLKLSRDDASHASAQMSARVAALEERRIAAAGAQQRIESMVAEVQIRIGSLNAQIAANAAEKLQREQENVLLAAQLETLTTEAAQQRASQEALKQESELVRTGLATIEVQLKEMRAHLDALRDRKGELSAQQAKLRSDADHMAETCRNELSLEREALLADDTVPRVDGEQLAAEDALYHEMRVRLEAMGPVNILALDEYKEAAERHAFLEAQRKDLLDSIENTQSTILEIDSTCAEKFKLAFNTINENFQHTFRKLFGGGQAFMRLTDEENSNESGIDIIASPPGKKLQNVLLLSGGEKALTALSLLVGIFQFQPSPFCILDEVDAPLDEANVGRFAEMVREMAVQTQFVLITHNKKTMSIAPVMYGVTMQEPGVSKVVSVRFGDEARASA